MAHLTLRTSEYSVFGLRAGGTVGQAPEIRKPGGNLPASRDNWSIRCEKGGVFIRLEFGDGKISALSAFVKSTNAEDVDF